jgi:putative DNA primase/helicase
MNAQEVLGKLQGVKTSGDGWTAKCPAHPDERNSLSVDNGGDGRVLIHCHAGCSYEAVCAALGMTRSAPRRVVASYDYRDEQGTLLYQSLRYEPKGFCQRRPEGAGWSYKLNGVRRVPYRLPELLAADSRKTVFVVEGEKDADRLAALGCIATTNAGGAGKWRTEFNGFLAGRSIVIVPDNDEPGLKHARQVAQSLTGIASSVRILELPNLPPKGDVSDWLDAGGTAEALQTLAGAAPLDQHQEAELPLKIVRMADVQPEQVRWLWHPYIALGKLTFLEGDPGLGKSWLTCAFACAVTRGCGLPNAEPFEPGFVLMLSAEDGLGDTLRPRLDAVGADTACVFALAEPLTFDDAGLLRLEAAIIEHKPDLVVIDPLFAFTGGKVDIHRANECRAITSRLAAIAERHGCAILAVRHLAKARGGGHALNAGIGSIDFAAAARSVLLVGRDPEDEQKRALVQTKNNLAPCGEAVGYKLEAGHFFWTGESDLTAGRILSVVSNDEERSALTEAVDFLRAALSGGEREVDDVKAEARRAGIAEATLRRARERLSIKASRQGIPGTRQRFVWCLPTSDDAQSSADSAQSQSDEHHRISGTGKSSYDNGLADDAQVGESGHYREDVCTSSECVEPLSDEEAELAARLEFMEGLPRDEAERRAREWFAPVPF